MSRKFAPGTAGASTRGKAIGTAIAGWTVNRSGHDTYRIEAANCDGLSFQRGPCRLVVLSCHHGADQFCFFVLISLVMSVGARSPTNAGVRQRKQSSTNSRMAEDKLPSDRPVSIAEKQPLASAQRTASICRRRRSYSAATLMLRESSTSAGSEWRWNSRVYPSKKGHRFGRRRIDKQRGTSKLPKMQHGMVLADVTPHQIAVHMERHTFLCVNCNQTRTYMLFKNK